jgi:uncharacterized protein (UPF0303 family)
MNNTKTNFDSLAEQEKTLEFEKFSRKDALALGLLLNENAKNYSDPISIEITLNGLAVFRYFSEGSIADSELWLVRKRNTVNLMSMSSLRFMYWLDMIEETIASRKLNPNDYAAGGGGFPICLRGTGVVGSICVSGLPNHLDDHKLIVDTISEFLK